ncbi:MAG: HEPN domain-containing protein [Ginsengibacter sp.]
MSLKDETIKLKISKALSIFPEVKVLMENKFYTTAISRLYYSCFHATKAILLTKDLMPKTHKGTSTLLHEQFVKSGLFDNEKATFFDNLMHERIEDDYNDYMITDKEQIIHFIEPGKDYVEYISKLINAYFDAQRRNSTIE